MLVADGTQEVEPLVFSYRGRRRLILEVVDRPFQEAAPSRAMRSGVVAGGGARLVMLAVKVPVTPGDQLVYKINVIKNKGAIWQLDAKAYVDDKVVAQAELKAMIVDK